MSAKFIRIAERTLSANYAWPRELKRAYKEAVSTGAGTASSTAALIVHRPSPESDTHPLERGKSRVPEQGGSGEVQQPRRDDATASPDLGNVREIEVV